MNLVTHRKSLSILWQAWLIWESLQGTWKIHNCNLHKVNTSNHWHTVPHIQAMNQLHCDMYLNADAVNCFLITKRVGGQLVQVWKQNRVTCVNYSFRLFHAGREGSSNVTHGCTLPSCLWRSVLLSCVTPCTRDLSAQMPHADQFPQTCRTFSICKPTCAAHMCLSHIQRGLTDWAVTYFQYEEMFTCLTFPKHGLRWLKPH